jgi:hypothetical protein
MASFFHLVGLILVSIALMLLGADIVTTIETNVMTVRSLDHVLAFFQASPKALVDANQTAWWAGVANGFIMMPAWILPGVFGFLISLPSRHKRPPPQPQIQLRPPGY